MEKPGLELASKWDAGTTGAIFICYTIRSILLSMSLKLPIFLRFWDRTQRAIYGLGQKELLQEETYRRFVRHRMRVS